eukprot:7567730-Alexandrium_andersonii.AAC.1
MRKREASGGSPTIPTDRVAGAWLKCVVPPEARGGVSTASGWPGGGTSEGPRGRVTTPIAR